MLSALGEGEGLYEGYIDFPAGGVHYFKYTSTPDWGHVVYGDGGNGNLTVNGKASLVVPDGGYYELSADLSKNKWTATKTTWSIIGNATPGGWEKDTPLTYDSVKQVWTATVAITASGSFKFRANNAWKIDFGIDEAGDLQYADNPLLPYNAGLRDLTVPSDGMYIVTLDLHVPGSYTYSLVMDK